MRKYMTLDGKEIKEGDIVRPFYDGTNLFALDLFAHRTAVKKGGQLGVNWVPKPFDDSETYFANKVGFVPFDEISHSKVQTVDKVICRYYLVDQPKTFDGWLEQYLSDFRMLLDKGSGLIVKESRYCKESLKMMQATLKHRNHNYCELQSQTEELAGFVSAVREMTVEYRMAYQIFLTLYEARERYAEREVQNK